MKKTSFIPIIIRFIISSLLYIVLPCILFFSGLVKIIINDKYGSLSYILIFVGIVLYLIYISTRFIPGIYAICDLVTNNFIEEKMSFVNSYLSDSGLYTRNHNNVSKNRLSVSYTLHIILAGNRGKSAFTTIFMHNMKSGKSYTVLYGKYSKILISVLDETGREMLMIEGKSNYPD